MASTGRNKLTEAEKEARRLEKEALMSDRKKRPRPIVNTDTIKEQTGTNNNTMEENANNNQNQNTGTNNPVETTNTNNPVENTGTNNTTTPAETVKSETIITSEDKHQNIAAKPWKPFDGNKVKREYSTPAINPELLNTDIPEVNINETTNPAITADSAKNILTKPIETANTAPVGPPPKPKPIVDGWDQLTPQEQQQSAAQTTDMILGVYDKLHYFGREIIKIDEEEVIEAHNDDKIDMHAGIIESDEDPEKEVTIQEFWQDFNKQVEDKFVVSASFKAEVRPPMERLCMKYGLGASDGLFLAFKFSEDAATKIAMLVGFKKTVNKMTEHFEKRHTKFKADVEKEVQRQLALERKNNPVTETKETVVKTETPVTNPADTANTTNPSEEKK